MFAGVTGIGSNTACGFARVAPKHLGMTEQTANAIAFIASNTARFIRGQSLGLGGGIQD